MQSQERYNFRLTKYHKLNIAVVLIILLIIMIVFFWYERSLDKIDAEMTKQMIGNQSQNGTIEFHL